MKPIPSRLLTIGLLSGSVLLAGCATTKNLDPLESINRKTFALNEGIDKVLLKPAATAYEAVLPTPVRSGISNFFSNLSDPWSGVNLLLQGRIKQGLSDFARFGTNTSVGLLGFMDVATDWGLPKHGQSFGDTLGAWGVGSGAYLVLPLFGPSDVRGAAAIPVNSLASLQSQVGDVGVRNSMTALNLVDKRAQRLPVTTMIDEAALDKYLFVRDAYIQRRKHGDSSETKQDDSSETVSPGSR